MNWADYEIFDPGVDRPLGELSRREARAAYIRLMEARTERIAQLRKLASANGVDLGAPDGVQQLNDWFVASVEPNPSVSGRLDNVWYSVVNDIGLYLGEQVIDASGGKLRWEFFTAGTRDVSYQRHVVMGFAVPNPNFNHDFDMAVAFYGHRIVRGESVEPDFFVKMLRTAVDQT